MTAPAKLPVPLPAPVAPGTVTVGFAFATIVDGLMRPAATVEPYPTDVAKVLARRPGVFTNPKV